jgi:uncharacterized membrane protein (DUF485 family)
MKDRIRREVLSLIGLVVLVDLVFVAAYFAFAIRSASDSIKLGFTVVWTLVTLALVIRGLTRVRSARLEESSGTRR